MPFMTAREIQPRQPMRCLDCGYDLRELSEYRCPECGRRYDPAKPETFLQQPARAQRLLMVAIASLPIILWPILAARFGWTRHIPIWLMPLGPVSIISGFAMSWEAARRSIQILRGRHPWVQHHWAALPAAIIGMAIACAFLCGTFGMLLYEWLT